MSTVKGCKSYTIVLSFNILIGIDQFKCILGKKISYKGKLKLKEYTF